MLAIGAKPDNALATACGLAPGVRGSIKVDDTMQTSDPDIYAVGDAVEVYDVVTEQLTTLPLAGPANRQGRLAADAIKHHGNPKFRGVQVLEYSNSLSLLAVTHKWIETLFILFLIIFFLLCDCD